MLTKLKSLKNHAGFIRYFKNTSWMMAEQFLRIIAGLFVGIWVARYLGPEQFGLFSYVLAFTAIFGGIAKLGLDGIVVRELVNHPEKQDVYLGTAFWLKLIGAFIVMGLMAAIVPFTSNDTTTNTFIFIIAAGLVFQSFEVVEFYFQSQVLAKIVSICKVTQLVLSSTIKVYLVLTGADLIWFVLVTAFDAVSIAVSYIIAYKLRGDNAFYKFFDFKIAKYLLQDSWPFIFSAVFAMVYLRIDQIMIKEMLGEHDVGIYSAAIRLSEAFYFLPALITTSLFPAIINSKKNNEVLYLERLQKLYALLVWLALSIAITLTFIGQSLISVLFGETYAGAGNILVVHVWASVFIFISAGFGRYLIVENLAIINMYRVVLGATFNVLLNLVLIPNYGVIGAAYATLFSLMLINFVFDVFNKKLWCQLHMKLVAFYYPLLLIYRIVYVRQNGKN
jgi:O-antigen/teichoic acid export membrane protein